MLIGWMWSDKEVMHFYEIKKDPPLHENKEGIFYRAAGVLF